MTEASAAKPTSVRDEALAILSRLDAVISPDPRIARES
jgi:hypothetical protein